MEQFCTGLLLKSDSTIIWTFLRTEGYQETSSPSQIGSILELPVQIFTLRLHDTVVVSPVRLKAMQ